MRLCESHISTRRSAALGAEHEAVAEVGKGAEVWSVLCCCSMPVGVLYSRRKGVNRERKISAGFYVPGFRFWTGNRVRVGGMEFLCNLA